MRCTDILRSLIAQKILYNDKKKILFFGTTMFQNRNLHNLNSDFEQEIPMYLNNHKIYELLKKIKLKEKKENYFENLIICYEAIIKANFISRQELKFLKLWIKDLKKII